MATETIDLPAVGKVNKTYVYVGGAAAAGIVVYAWWSRSRTPAPVYDVDTVGETEYKAPGGGGGSTYTGPMPEGINSNLEWAKEAVEWFASNGYDTAACTIAVTRYLARKPLNTREQEWVSIVVTMIGEPPEGRPWKIIPDPTPDAPKSWIVPDLDYEHSIPDAAWRATIVLPGETWVDINKRLWPEFDETHPAWNQQVLEDTWRAINKHITGSQPKAGDTVFYQ